MTNLSKHVGVRLLVHDGTVFLLAPAPLRPLSGTPDPIRSSF